MAWLLAFKLHHICKKAASCCVDAHFLLIIYKNIPCSSVGLKVNILDMVYLVPLCTETSVMIRFGGGSVMVGIGREGLASALAILLLNCAAQPTNVFSCKYGTIEITLGFSMFS